MIKIEIEDNIKEFIYTEHYKDISVRVKSIIGNINGKIRYKKFQDYFCDTSGNIIENRLKKLIIGNKNDLIEIINFVGEIPLEKNDQFDKLYTNFTSRVWSKSLLEKINVKVCPYCNSQSIPNIVSAGIRPQFDHYFPKSLFSYLSASLYNLIPSCSICNSKKHALNTYKSNNDLYYPYEDEFGSEVVFQTCPNDNDFSYMNGETTNFDIKLYCVDNKHNCKVENINKHLKIELLYKEHKNHVRDIIKNAIINNDSRIDELLEHFPDLFQSKTEVISLIFMSNIEKKDWGERPLSKLTHDIYKEFKLFSSND